MARRFDGRLGEQRERLERKGLISRFASFCAVFLSSCLLIAYLISVDYNEGMKSQTVLLAVALSLCLVVLTSALSFDLPPSQQKCFRELLSRHQVISGEISTISSPFMQLKYWVRIKSRKCEKNEAFNDFALLSVYGGGIILMNELL